MKRQEADEQLEVMQLSQADYQRRLSNCIQMGKPALFEGVGEDVDPGLEPVLLKSVYKVVRICGVNTSCRKACRLFPSLKCFDITCYYYLLVQMFLYLEIFIWRKI